MIYGRGSLESRAMKMPSAWKSNKHPPWTGERGGGMFRKLFTGWSCIKQTSPPQIFMGRDLLINLSLSSISLFCIHQGLVIGHNRLHFTSTWVRMSAVSVSACVVYKKQIMSRFNIWVFHSVVWFRACARNQVECCCGAGIRLSSPSLQLKG